jgi:hypothetical protein
VGIALLRTPPGVAPNISPAIEKSVGDGTDVRIEPKDDRRAADPIDRDEPAESRPTAVSTAPLSAIPQNAEDLRVGYPLLAKIIEANERDLAAEGKDPLWSTDMERQIVSEISQKALGLEITDLQVDCRTTRCRVNMTFALQLLQKTFAGTSSDTVWDGRQPVMFFVKALDLDFRQQVAVGLNAYGTPVLVGYVFRPPEKTTE